MMLTGARIDSEGEAEPVRGALDKDRIRLNSNDSVISFIFALARRERIRIAGGIGQHLRCRY